MCRIYDKAGESNCTIDAIRYEFEYHGKFCEDFARHIREFGTVPAFTEVFNTWVVKVLPEGFNKKIDLKQNRIQFMKTLCHPPNYPLANS